MSPQPLLDEFVRPDYSGGTIANVPGTVAALLDVPFNGLPPLADSLWRPLGGNVRRVIVLLLDSLGWNLVEALRAELSSILDQATVVGQITSIFPSTTVAALTSLWTGLAPAQHGLVGLRLFFPALGVLGQMLKFSPTFASFPDSLINAGIKPENFLTVPGFAQQLAQAGIPSYSFKNFGIINSALSQMHDRGVKRSIGVDTLADLLVQLRLMLEETAGAPLYAYAYWSSIDSLSHIYGYDHPSVAAELRAMGRQIRLELLDKLSAAARRDTVLCILADHGQVISSPQEHIYLDQHPALMPSLLMRPAGEPRTAYLYARQGAAVDALAYLRAELSQELLALPSPAALEMGLFGPEPFAPETAARLGDLVTIMRHNYLLLTPPEREHAATMPGRHGSMTPQEMKVPWIAARLDA
jgi:hypothetical protein